VVVGQSYLTSFWHPQCCDQAMITVGNEKVWHWCALQ